MMKLVVICAILACAFAEKPTIGFGSFSKYNPKFGSKIVGGDPANLGDFPYIVSLQLAGGLLGNGHYCGGALVSPSTVVTAGHCVTEVNPGILQHIEIHGGLISLANPGPSEQISRVTKTIVNPDFPGGVAPNDIAIHILSAPFVLNANLSPLNLPTEQIIPEGVVTLAGWGSTSHTQTPSMPDKLQTIQLPIVPFDECKTAIDAIEEGSVFEESMVCTGPLVGGFGACSGDSGSPLVSGEGSNRTIVGVVSWGFIPCAQSGAPSVYTNPSFFLNFIEENLV